MIFFLFFQFFATNNNCKEQWFIYVEKQAAFKCFSSTKRKKKFIQVMQTFVVQLACMTMSFIYISF